MYKMFFFVIVTDPSKLFVTNFATVSEIMNYILQVKKVNTASAM